MIPWATRPLTDVSLITKFTKKSLKQANKIEKQWVKDNVGIKSKNWAGTLGEELVRFHFQNRELNIWKPKKMECYCPDFETDNYVIEVKTRNWTTTGTAGEKVLGVPYKYSDIPQLYGKPLLIVCVAYQEWELTNKRSTQVFGEGVSPSKKYLLDVWKKMNIEFVPYSKLNEYT